jgi:hypothetical protein
VGGPQNKFRKFADLKNSLICEPPQMWQFAYLRFEDPMFLRFADLQFANLRLVHPIFRGLKTFTSLQKILYILSLMLSCKLVLNTKLKPNKPAAELICGFVMKGPKRSVSSFLSYSDKFDDLRFSDWHN